MNEEEINEYLHKAANGEIKLEGLEADILADFREEMMNLDLACAKARSLEAEWNKQDQIARTARGKIATLGSLLAKTERRRRASSGGGEGEGEVQLRGVTPIHSKG